MRNWNILIVGVGGQGTLLASKVLGKVAQLCGCDIKVSEVHGMAQRGGSVVTYVRFGSRVHSPLIEQGGADVILSFEKLEALRYLPYASRDAYIISNTQEISPMPVVIGEQKYPQDIQETLDGATDRYITVDAARLASQAGSPRAANIVILGVLSSIMDIDEGLWMESIEQCVPPKSIDINKKAFSMGKNWKGM